VDNYFFALIDRMKTCNDIPTPIAERITGHASTQYEFSSYGTIGFTLEQKVVVLKRVAGLNVPKQCSD
jgi:hypothetical protein